MRTNQDLCFSQGIKDWPDEGEFTSPLAKHIQNADNWLPTRNTKVVARIPKHKTLAPLSKYVKMVHETSKAQPC